MTLETVNNCCQGVRPVAGASEEPVVAGPAFLPLPLLPAAGSVIAGAFLLITPSPVSMSSVHTRGSGRTSLPSPISSGIHRYRESHCEFGRQMSPMKITVVVCVPTTFSSIVDWLPYVFVCGGAMSLNADHGPSKDLAVAYKLGLGFQPVRCEPIA